MPIEIKGPAASSLPALADKPQGSLVIPTASASPDSPPSSAAIERVKQAGQTALTQARTLTVSDPGSLQSAADARSQLKRAMDQIEGLLRPNINRLHKAHKDAVQELKQILSPFEQADTYLKSQQDQYQLRERRQKEEERRRLEAAMEAERRRMIEEDLARAVQEQKPEAITEIVARASEPPPSLPSVNRAVKAEGASVRWLPKFRLLDLGKVSPDFITRAIWQEIEEKGECEWLMKIIRREVERVGKRAEETVGRGSIEYYEEPSTGSRR